CVTRLLASSGCLTMLASFRQPRGMLRKNLRAISLIYHPAPARQHIVFCVVSVRSYRTWIWLPRKQARATQCAALLLILPALEPHCTHLSAETTKFSESSLFIVKKFAHLPISK